MEEAQHSQRRISFDAAVGALSTRGTASEYTGGDFGCYSWRTAGTWGSTADADKLKTKYIINEKTTKSSGKWYPGDFTYPTTGYLHFACYAPYNKKSPMTFTYADGICFDDYSITDAPTADLLYSDFDADMRYVSGSATPDCPILFHHALCEVTFDYKTDDIPSGLTSVVTSRTVTLKFFSISGMKTTGDFAQNSTPQWSSLSGSAADTIFNGTKVLTTAKETGKTFYVLPQPFEADVQAINLKYDVSVTYSDSSVKTKSFDETFYFKDLTLNGTWAPGKKINYTITISAFGEPVGFTSSTEDWTGTTISNN